MRRTVLVLAAVAMVGLAVGGALTAAGIAHVNDDGTAADCATDPYDSGSSGDDPALAPDSSVSQGNDLASGGHALCGGTDPCGPFPVLPGSPCNDP